MNIPWIAAFCETASAEERLLVMAEALEGEFGHVLKSGEPIAWQKAAAGVIKHLREKGVL